MSGIEPVVKSVHVPSPPARAFTLFTTRMGRWWPRAHHLGSTALIDVVLEPEVGGRLYSQHEGGQLIVFGHVLAWEPPALLRFTWEISADWKADASLASQVEVLFVPAGSETRMELTHSHFEMLGAQAGARMRDDVDRGWPQLLKQYFDFLMQSQA